MLFAPSPIFLVMPTSLTRPYAALALVCVLWGTTFLAIRIALDSLPPFLLLGLRHTAAGLILLVIGVLTGRVRAPLAAIRAQWLNGVLMIGLGNGLVGWGEQYIGTGLASLLCALNPVMVVLLNIGFGERRELNGLVGGGLGLGLAGLALLFRDQLLHDVNAAPLAGATAIVLAVLAWTGGSLLSKRQMRGAIDPVASAVGQMICGGAFLLLLSLCSESWQLPHPPTTASLLALLHLVLLGSLAGYLAFLYALRKLPAGVASLYAYVNPLIAVALGWAFRHEQVTLPMLAAIGLILIGVFLVNLGYQPQRQPVYATDNP